MVPFSSLSFWFVCNELFIMFAEENGTIRDLRINLHNSVLFNFLFQKSTTFRFFVLSLSINNTKLIFYQICQCCHISLHVQIIF